MYILYKACPLRKKKSKISHTITFFWQNDDFNFESEIPIKPRRKTELSGSDFARGGASDNDSLLERKEVLAGMCYIKPTLFQYCDIGIWIQWNMLAFSAFKNLHL